MKTINKNIRGEVWKNVIGYEGLCMVSNKGRVKTMSRLVFDRNGVFHYTQKGKIMKGTAYADYPIVRLRKNSFSRNTQIHRLVAIAFISNKGNKPFINHKNGDKQDNRAGNLEWCTKSENEKHAYKYLGETSYFKGLYGKNHPNSIPVYQKDLAGNLIKRWDCAHQAKREEGYQPACIGMCLSGKLQTHRGFKWTANA